MCYHIIGLPVLLRDTRNGDHIVDEAIDDLNLGRDKIVDLLLVAEEVLMRRREGREGDIPFISRPEGGFRNLWFGSNHL